LLVVSEELYPKFATIIASCPELEHVVVSGANGHGHDRLEDLLQAAGGPAVTAATTCDDMCFWLYTSGSTGRPKGAVHVH
ncbi:AMP-binding protein, partial [Klebsiella pneumoniae]|nr:AMP-binding protein [Klebsiella pneumoniae]